LFAGRSKQLTIYLGETDQYHHKPLYMAILEMLRREGLGGATVLRGVAGFGASSRIHTSAILRLSMDLPIVVVVVDRPERIERMIEPLRQMAPASLITVEDVEVVHVGAPFKEGLPDVTVGEVMQSEVVTVSPDSPITAVVELLLDKDFTAVPVVDEDRKVVGMVSDRDLLTRGGMSVGLSLKRAADPDFVRALHAELKNPARKVRDVMATSVISVKPDASLGSAAKLMVDEHLKRLPVIDDEGRLVGILGRLDVLNTIAAVSLPQWHPEARAVSTQARVAEVMSREVPAVHESATLGEIFELLISSAHKRVVVVDDQRRVVGIIADSDLVSRVNPESRPGLIELLVSKVPIEAIGGEARKHLARIRGRSAAELMTREVVTVREEMPVASALALSAEKRVKRIPVVDAENRLVGIVGRTEMMRALLGGGK